MADLTRPPEWTRRVRMRCRSWRVASGLSALTCAPVRGAPHGAPARGGRTGAGGSRGRAWTGRAPGPGGS